MTAVNTAGQPQDFIAQRKRILASMSLALLVIIATITSINLALPEMAVDLGASFTQVTWIADAYTVAIAALVLPFGAIADRYGRKRLMILGLVLFGIIGAFAVFQTTPGGIILSRALMGMAAAMIMPGTLATITSSFPPEERTRGVATWAGIAGAGAVFGLVTSGILLEYWSWKSVFVFAAIMAAVAAIGVWRGAPETGGHYVKFDWIGSFLSASGLGLLVFGIIDAGEVGLADPVALGAIGLGIALLVLFVRHSLHTDEPLLDVRVFRNKRFTVGTITVTSQFLAQFGFFFIAMQYLQLVMEYSPLRSALAMFPLALVVMPLSQLVPKILKSVPVRIILPMGILFLMIGLIVLATMDKNSGYLHFAAGLMVLGAGVAFTAPPATTAITEGLPRDKQGTASAVNDVTRELGAALGIALMGAVFTTTYSDSVAPLTERFPETMAEAIERSPSAGMEVAANLGPMGEGLKDGVMRGFMDGTQASLATVAIYLGIVAVSMAVLLFKDDKERARIRAAKQQAASGPSESIERTEFQETTAPASSAGAE